LSVLSTTVGGDLVTASAGRNPKSAVVWVSANAGLFGDIIEKTLEHLLVHVRSHTADVFVLGQVGKQLLESFASDVHARYIPFQDDVADETFFHRLLEQLSGYEHITIWYGKFKSIAVQSPDSRTVSGQMLADVMNTIDPKERRHREFTYIYEPDPSVVSKYMASEILNTVVEQTIFEAQLGKYASRLMHLDESIDHIEDRIDVLDRERRVVKKIREDRKQRTMLAGMRARQ